MRRRTAWLFIMAVAGLLGAPPAARAQAPAPAPAPAPASAPAPAAWQPALADVMLMTVQPRHAKLGLAGAAGNWPLADFAAHELEESLEAAAKLRPVWREQPVGAMIEAMLKDALEPVEAAIKKRDKAGFTKAYGALTQACNACHQAVGMGMIVMQVPSASAFPNQDFRAKP